MAEGNLAEADVPFDLDAWAIQHKLSRKTTGALRKDECDQVDSLKLLTSSDINRLDVAVGQIRLLRLALRALGNPIKLDDLAKAPEEQGDQDAEDPGGEDDEAELGDNGRVLEEAGDQLANLLRQQDDPESLMEQLPTVPVPKPSGARVGRRATTYAQYDPLMHLTVKSGKKKALQIEQFLPDPVRTRVNRRKRDQLTFTTTAQGGLTLKKDDSGSVYVTVAEWNGANMRLCSHMLNNGLIKECELIYYMAYTAMIADLAGRYEWASILEYDVRYRELQAEHGFLWGTPHPHTEMHMLIPRKSDPQSKPKAPAASAHGHDKPRQKVDVPCRKWLAKRECDFGEHCIYRHDKVGASATKAPPPKNE